MPQIADYVLSESLGTGNHGAYWRARPPTRLSLDADWVAVKVLDKNASEDDFRRFANELRLFAAVKSDYLVSIHDAGHQDGILYYCTEYFPLGSLGEPAEDASKRDSVRAVAHAARTRCTRLKFAHRDIKPTNIMLRSGGGKLSDLGLAQVLTPGLTLTGTGPIGTIQFMEPGVARGEKASRASDIWELGASLHWVLGGGSVYGEIPTDNMLAAISHVLDTKPRVDARLADDERAIVARCIADAPEDRPATAAELADELDKLIA